jgi:hypothetical protein
MTKWTYYQWLGGPMITEHRGTLRLRGGNLVEVFSASTNTWTKVPNSILLDRLEDGAIDIEPISEERALELTGTTHEHPLGR